MEKWRISSRDGRVNVTVLERAFAALAKFNIRICNEEDKENVFSFLEQEMELTEEGNARSYVALHLRLFEKGFERF